MVVERQQVLAAGIERVRFADELESLCRIRRKDDDVLIRIRVEEVEHGKPRLFDEGRSQRRCRVGRVRVSEQMIAQQRRMPIDEGKRHEIAGRVIEIYVSEAVEQRILARAQIVERTGR